MLLKGMVLRKGHFLLQGAVWGQDVILDNAKNRDPALAVAFTHCHVSHLSRKSLDGLLQVFPFDNARVRRARCVMALLRGAPRVAKEILKGLFGTVTQVFTQSRYYLHYTARQWLPSIRAEQKLARGG